MARNPAVGLEAGTKTAPARSPDKPDLQSQYGSIGINAVSAAARYSNSEKKPAESSKAPRIDQRFQE
jgi:hypothetical protein